MGLGTIFKNMLVKKINLPFFKKLVMTSLEKEKEKHEYQ